MLSKKERDFKAAQNLNKIWKAHSAATGKNQTQIASDLHMSQGNFSQYLTGHNTISINKLFVFMEYFDCKASDLFEELN